jgi:cytochrome c oxidase cbb3-type subunit 3
MILRMLAMLASIGFLAGCGRPEEEVRLPDQVIDFHALFASNCAGCHGTDGHNGAAQPLNDPVYQALVTKEKLQDVIAHGVPGMPMPAFAKSAGGTLTDQQIESLANGMQRTWAKPEAISGASLPSHSSTEAGEIQRGAVAYQTYCARCHGPEGRGGSGGGSIVEPDYLALVSNQKLRTAVIAGRPDRGVPDWRNDVPGRPLARQEISDVVAWVASHRRSGSRP